jgi:DNA-binding response OmpR family regulator
MLTQLAPKILILESQMIIAADVSLQLSKLGYNVIGINTRPEDVLKIIQNNRPDIVIMNIKIQGKTDGLKIARNVLETHQIPVIFLSANTDKEIFKELIDTQPYAFIPKPFDEKDLKRGIETTLKRMAGEEFWGKKTQRFSSTNSLFIRQENQFIKIEAGNIIR